MMPAAPQPSSADATAPRRLAITNRTRRVLDHFLVDYGIKIVMCGHMHVPRLTRYNASNGTEKTTVLEARCGTTTQRDEFPYEIIQSIPVSRRLPPNTLIVHQVIERNRSLLWQSKIFWRNRSGRFVDSTQHTSPSVPQHLTAELELRPS